MTKPKHAWMVCAGPEYKAQVPLRKVWVPAE